MNHCVWYQGNRGSWAQTIVEWLTMGMQHHNLIEAVPAHEGAVVVVKADAIENPHHLLADIRRLPWCLLVVTANEEGLFQSDLFLGGNRRRFKMWLQTPAPAQVADRYFPWGWTPAPHVNGIKRQLDWCFLGQVTHARRRACVDAFRGLHNGLLIETEGFSKGLPHHLYHETLSATKVVPCPSGPLTVDSFRVCEALEAGAIPLLDVRSPLGAYRHYWTRVFDVTEDELPLPLVDDWTVGPQLTAYCIADWARHSQIVRQWWAWQKTTWSFNFDKDVKELMNAE